MFPFLPCEVFSCEIEGIFKTLLEDLELMDLLFSFLEPDWLHSTLSTGYFSKKLHHINACFYVPDSNLHIATFHTKKICEEITDDISVREVFNIVLERRPDLR